MNLLELTTNARFELVSLGMAKIALDTVIQSKLNSAYRLFVSLCGEIDDVELLDVYDSDEVVVPPHVRKIKRVFLGDKELAVVNRAALSDQIYNKHAPFFIIGDADGYASVVAGPATPYPLKLHIRRGVKQVMVFDTDTPTDVPEEFHPALVDKVVADMLRVQPGDMNRVAYIRDRDASFAIAIEKSKALFERRRSKPHRTVSYGGI